MNDLEKARRWATLYAMEQKTPVYIYRREDGKIDMTLVERNTAWIDGSAYTLLEVVYAAELLKE